VANSFEFGGTYEGYTESSGSLGLVKIGARYCDAAIGLWTQLDPLGGGYNDTNCNPINSIDPAGLQPVPGFDPGGGGVNPACPENGPYGCAADWPINEGSAHEHATDGSMPLRCMEQHRSSVKGI